MKFLESDVYPIKSRLLSRGVGPISIASFLAELQRVAMFTNRGERRVGCVTRENALFCANNRRTLLINIKLR